MESDSLTRAWAAALDAVPTDELGPVATSMLRSARPLGDIEGTILLAVPNDFTKQWIEDKAQSKLTTALSVHLGRTVRIAITVDPTLEVLTDEEEEEEFDDFEPVSRSERMDRTGGDRLERKAPKAQDSTGPIFPVENERRSNKVVNIHTTTQLQVVLVKPERFENASEIADHLREKRTVVLNLESTNKDIARRLLDFLSGVAYANEGKIKKVAISTYIITPYNVDILGDLIDELENNGLYF